MQVAVPKELENRTTQQVKSKDQEMNGPNRLSRMYSIVYKQRIYTCIQRPYARPQNERVPEVGCNN